jgi:hypothetical protein
MARRPLSVLARPGPVLLGIQPRHAAAFVPPDGEAQDHAPCQRLAHGLVSAEVHEPPGARSVAVLVRGVADLGQAGSVDLCVLDHLAVLYVNAVDLLEIAVGIGGELSHDGEGARGVDFEAWAIIVGLVEAVRVIATAFRDIVSSGSKEMEAWG